MAGDRPAGDIVIGSSRSHTQALYEYQPFLLTGNELDKHLSDDYLAGNRVTIHINLTYANVKLAVTKYVYSNIWKYRNSHGLFLDVILLEILFSKVVVLVKAKRRF